MNTEPGATEAIVRNHLQAFVEQKGIDALLSDYDDDARFHSEARAYRGKREIGDFFASFIGSLPPGATGRFSLRTLRVEGELAYITWSAGREILSARTRSLSATARSSHRHSRCTPQAHRTAETPNGSGKDATGFAGCAPSTQHRCGQR
jgi:ketosteroid isomerase-like protein